MITHYQPVRLSRTVRGKCPVCSKRVTRTKRFEQTASPGMEARVCHLATKGERVPLRHSPPDAHRGAGWYESWEGVAVWSDWLGWAMVGIV